MYKIAIGSRRVNVDQPGFRIYRKDLDDNEEATLLEFVPVNSDLPESMAKEFAEKMIHLWNNQEYVVNKGEISSEFTCKCGKQKGWITEGKKTLPCPECGRQYLGVYSPKKLTIEGKEI